MGYRGVVLVAVVACTLSVLAARRSSAIRQFLRDVSLPLLNALRKVRDGTTVAFIRMVYPCLVRVPVINFYLLDTLTKINTSESLALLVDILTERRPDVGYFYHDALFAPLYRQMQHPHVLFPRLLVLSEDARYKAAVYSLAAFYRNHDLVANATLAAYRQQVLDDWHDAAAVPTAAPPDSGEAADALNVLEILADYMAAFPGDPEITAILRRSASDPQARIALYSVLSLVRMGEPVSAAELERVAAKPEVRLELYESLQEMEQLHLFPQAYLTQYHFAEANMVRWLCFPTELGRPPSDIQFIESREVTLGGERGRVYLFKFLDTREDGWMVGLSGPQPIDLNSVRTSGYATFSCFNQLDAGSIDEHFDCFLG